MILDPEGIPMVEYMDSVVIFLDYLGLIPRFSPPMTWVEWAQTVVQIPGVAQFHPPDPDQYTEWLPWALEFNKTVMVNIE